MKTTVAVTKVGKQTPELVNVTVDISHDVDRAIKQGLNEGSKGHRRLQPDIIGLDSK